MKDSDARIMTVYRVVETWPGCVEEGYEASEGVVLWTLDGESAEAYCGRGAGYRELRVEKVERLVIGRTHMVDAEIVELKP